MLGSLYGSADQRLKAEAEAEAEAEAKAKAKAKAKAEAKACHSRYGGNPRTLRPPDLKSLDSRLRGNDGRRKDGGKIEAKIEPKPKQAKARPHRI